MDDGDRPPASPTRALALLMRSPRAVLAVAVLIGLAAVALASRLELRTAFTELLPSKDPAVLALKRTEGRVGDLNLLTIGIRSPDRAKNLAYAKALTEALRALPPTEVGLVAYDIKDLQAFFKQHQWLYPSLDDLESIRDRLRREILKHKNPLVVDLSDDEDDDGGTAKSDAALRARVDHQPLADRFPDGYFVRGDVAWVLVLPAGGLFGERAGESLVQAVDAFVAAHPPASFHPAMRVQALGPVVVGLENRKAVADDIKIVSAFCTAVIALSIGFYFRRVLAIPLVVLPALLGTAVAFAAGELAFGYLNSSTAFLGSIILGNGINHAIVLLSRYQETARRDDSPATVTAAVTGTGRATFTAALAASASYLSLTLTSFRGFSQFGVMAAVGSLACWASAYTTIPAWLWLRGGRNRPAAAPPPPLSLGPLAQLIARHATALAVATVVVTVAALYGLEHFARAPFEYDFRKLRADVAHTPERKQLDDNLNDLLGRWHSPTVVLADRLDQVEEVRTAIHRQDSPTRPVIGQVVTIYDVLPGAPAIQQQKLAVLAEIRKLARDPAVELLEPKQRADIDRLTPPEGLRELTPADLPPLARRPFTERDGTVGRVVLVYHAEKTVTMWDGHDLIAIANVLERLRLDDGTVIETSGTPMLFGAMLRSVLRDGPRATLLSFLGVALLMLALVRPPRAALVALGTLLTGVVWMVGAAGLLKVRITFLNFVALPITFGIGGEYAINVVGRWRRERSVIDAVRSVGAAVMLCSWTTIVGYGSLLAAHSQALRGFGAMAILGEIACLLAALVAAPVWLALRLQRRENGA
jgi:predicted RND superfamily exporter protein